MPLSPDEQEIADRLTGLYRATEASLLDQIAEAATSDSARSRLRALLAEVDRQLDALLADSRAWIAGEIPAMYASGASHAAGVVGGTFAWTDAHRQTVQALADRTWATVAETLQGLTADTKRTIRLLLDDTARRQILEGVPGTQGRAGFIDALRRETGLVTVRYADGSRHSLADWGDTTARTEVALTRNAGEFAQSRAEGVTFMLCLDGLACGLTAHNDPQPANGLVLPIGEAESWPLAHPRCARSWSPMPEVTTLAQAEAASLADDPALVAAERDRAARANVDTARGTFAAGRQPRTARQARQPRQPVDA